MLSDLKHSSHSHTISIKENPKILMKTTMEKDVINLFQSETQYQ